MTSLSKRERAHGFMGVLDRLRPEMGCFVTSVCNQLCYEEAADVNDGLCKRY